MNRFRFHTSLTLLISFTLFQLSGYADEIVWFDGHEAVTYHTTPKKSGPVVETALKMFCSDMEAVTGKPACNTNKSRACIHLIQLDKAGKGTEKNLKANGVPVDELKTKIDGFHISVIGGKITIVGTNARGTAYGIMEMSRHAGVSPWIWWGDCIPEKRTRLTIDEDYTTLQGASVEYRGIFLNDEDWSTRPWSYATNDPAPNGYIGKQTYKRMFQLLIRLRANAIWPGMHEGTTAFFQVEGAKAVADSCGIVIGTSHCEPLLRNNVGEWNEKERGKYNYMTNRQSVHDYWIERLQEVKNSQNNMFTIGMRGIHDGSMEGVKTMPEKFEALQQVINDQQTLLEKYIGKPEEQTQMFVPYKEVLEIYELGLKVPDYVTLMWCDDNYGYVTRYSTPEEQKRKGGAGIYYHLSYWGRPHDHLWLTTTQPGLIYNEMRAAYDHNVRKIWIANVHDMKVAGYDLELFLDMAWNINSVDASTIDTHYKNWLCRQFGEACGEKLFPAMYEWFRLCGERRPEFMGWTQVELSKKDFDRGLSGMRNTAFSTQAFGGELDRYLERYAEVANTVREAGKLIRPELKDAYFAAIAYPVWASAAHATKILESQRARSLASGSAQKDVQKAESSLYIATAKSQQAYQTIRSLTDYYNNKMTGGKWRHSMNMRPRDLPVFGAPLLPFLLTDKEVEEWVSQSTQQKKHPLKCEDAISRNASDWQTASPEAKSVKMLGHSMSAVSLPKGGVLTYEFESDRTADALLRVALIPTHPKGGGDLRFSISIDGGEEQVFSLKEKFRSEGWKQHVLRGQAVKELPIKLQEGKHTLTIKALDEHIVVDQWMVDYKPNRSFYLFPTENG